MGLLTKSIVILAIAVSTSLIYRQFVDEDSVKFMSTYYSNYKVIDGYLRQGAVHIDRAREYMPNSKQIQQVYDKLNKQFNQFLNPVKSSDEKKDGTSRSNDQGHSDKGEADVPHRLSSCPGEEVQLRLWSKAELSKFDGNLDPSRVYLGFLGTVYNVSLNVQHYGPGADYNAFAGRDATRAFVTGNFTHDLHDDIRDIDEKMYSHFETWASFYSTSYQSLGRIEGAFYDARGCATPELDRVYGVFGKLAQEKTSNIEHDKSLPECNTEWNGDLKRGRVWCSNKSGGIEREWVGVPRIYNDDSSSRCVCLNLDAPEAAQQAKSLGLYPGCEDKASECALME